VVAIRTLNRYGLKVDFDPNVWSGRAVQEASSTWLMRSCINVSGLWLERVVLRATMDISARASSLPDRPQSATHDRRVWRR
jgi:hypothetical protein